MYMIFLLIPAFIILILFEVPGLIRTKSWRDFAVYSIIMSLAFVISLLEILHVKIPNPVRETQYFVQNLLGLRYPME